MSALYRVGRHNPRNIYRGDEHIGVVFAPADGPLVVAALNAAAAGPPRCTACGRTARKLTPVFADADQITGWLGPGCWRKHLDALRDAALGDECCFLISVPLGGAR